MIATSSQFTSLEVHLSWGSGRHLSLRRPAHSLRRGLVLIGRTKSAEVGQCGTAVRPACAGEGMARVPDVRRTRAL